MKKTILVTGAAGFLGANLCLTLLKQKYRIMGVDNYITGQEKNIAELKKYKNFTFIKHNISKPLKIIGKIDQIYNLACPASPIDFPKLPFAIMEVCSAGVKNMLEMAKTKAARILHTSTSEVYGQPKENPQTENYLGNVNCYGSRACYDEGKRFAEALIFNYRQKYQVDTAIIRTFNTYGPRMRADDGRALTTFVVQALQNIPITIFGNGKQTRSFCYVDDQIKGYIAMMNSKKQGPINIGNPIEEYTMNHLAKKIIKLTGSKSKIVFKPLPKDDPLQRCPDISLARKKLNWKPKVSLNDGLIKTIQYFRKELK